MADEFDNASDQPPTEPGLYVDRGPIDDDDFPEAPGWPKTVGLISIILGVIGIGCAGCGFGMQFFFQGMMAQAFPDGVPPVAQHPPIANYIAGGFGILVTILEIIAGALLLMRKPVARPLHLAYGVLGLLSIVISIYLQLEVQSQIAEWCKQNPDTNFAKQQAMSGSIGPVVGAFVTAIFAIWPLFCLIWFGLVKRDSAEIARGADQLV